MVDLLLQHGANPFICANDGSVPIDVYRCIENVSIQKLIEDSMTAWLKGNCNYNGNDNGNDNDNDNGNDNDNDNVQQELEERRMKRE